MSPNGGGVEHLHEMGGLAVRGERLEQGLEDTRLAQPPKAFPDAVPVAELGRERPPRDVVDREIVQRLEELAVVAGKSLPPALGRPGGMKRLRLTIGWCGCRQRGRFVPWCIRARVRVGPGIPEHP